jgi:thiamine pyrophosphokinase
MSSHHIVRDNQEPALLVLGSDQNPFNIIESLLEWSPFIVVAESEVDLLLSKGIKIDAVVFRKINQEAIIEKIIHQFPVDMVIYKENENSLTKALSFLKEKKHFSVNVVMDDLNLLTQLESSDGLMNISIFHDSIRWSLVRSGNFEKWVDFDARLFLLEENQRTILKPDSENRITVKRERQFWIGEELG